ncbi:hypothetical protein EV702DRAFT_1196537 [Suillus placidus]|uniref:Uncharacterized protein n=1 Tax=Suillus placidus TaxID=48579 RepID=A0A9P6ZWM3_9AGAM|nr:hypothetical protein EV702DRAFT_1196537 [Suillus placidus]
MPSSECLETLLMDKEDGVVEGCGELHGGDEDEEVPLMLHKALIADLSAHVPSQSSGHLLPQNSSAPPLPQGPRICSDDYVLYNDCWVHKQTVCRLVVNKDFVSKSPNHLKCVHEGFTKVNKQIDMSAGRITDCDLFLVGDIFLTILCSGHTLSIGALRTTAKISGQLLTIITNHPSPDTPLVFLWDGGYVTSCLVIQGSSQSTERVIVITVPGSLIEPINPEPTFFRLHNDINTDAFFQVNGGQSTWEIPWDVLQGACDLLRAKAVDIQSPLSQ